MTRKIFTTLLEAVQAHAVADEDSGCWIWTGARMTGSRTPVMRWQGRVGAVRRFIVEDKYGENFDARGGGGKLVVASNCCGDVACVSWEHAVAMPRQRLQRRTMETAAWVHDPVLRKNRSAFARSRFARLDAQKADLIREDDRVQWQIAKEFNVSQATVSKIKTGRTWKDYDNTNPFKGLIK
jgi:hypothetical protein